MPKKQKNQTLEGCTSITNFGVKEELEETKPTPVSSLGLNDDLENEMGKPTKSKRHKRPKEESQVCTAGGVPLDVRTGGVPLDVRTGGVPLDVRTAVVVHNPVSSGTINNSVQHTQSVRQAQKTSTSERRIEERRIILPDGSISSTSVTTEQVVEREESVTIATMVQEVTHFMESTVTPALTWTGSMINSLLLKMIRNRFDMAQAQDLLMTYKDDPVSPGFFLSPGPHFHRPIKLLYNVFRGLNTFANELVLQNLFTLKSPRIPILFAGTCPTSEETAVALIQSHEWDVLIARYRMMFPRAKPLELGKWCYSNFMPLTVEELLLMILCRFEARQRHFPMSAVDEEEKKYPLPILDIKIDVETSQEWKPTFGSRQQIVKDIRSVPINGIQSSLNQEDHNDKVDMPTSEFTVWVQYNMTSIESQIGVGISPHIYQCNERHLVRYAELRGCQRAGIDVSEQWAELQSQLAGPSGKKTEFNAIQSLYTRLPQQAFVKSNMKLDIEAVGAIRKYISWAHAKRTAKTTRDLLHYEPNQTERSYQHLQMQQLKAELVSARKQQLGFSGGESTMHEFTPQELIKYSA